MAARRATEEDLRDMEKNLREMETEIDAGGLGSAADVRFHMAIAYATKNMVQIHIMKSFYDLLFYGIKTNLQYLYTEPATLEIITRSTTIFSKRFGTGTRMPRTALCASTLYSFSISCMDKKVS